MGSKILPMGDMNFEPRKKASSCNQQPGTCYLLCRDLTLSLLIVLTGFLLFISVALTVISIFECVRSSGREDAFFRPTTPMRAVTKSIFSDFFGPKEGRPDDFF